MILFDSIWYLYLYVSILNDSIWYYISMFPYYIYIWFYLILFDSIWIYMYWLTIEINNTNIIANRCPATIDLWLSIVSLNANSLNVYVMFYISLHIHKIDGVHLILQSCMNSETK